MSLLGAIWRSSGGSGRSFWGAGRLHSGSIGGSRRSFGGAGRLHGGQLGDQGGHLGAQGGHLGLREVTCGDIQVFLALREVP